MDADEAEQILAGRLTLCRMRARCGDSLLVGNSIRAGVAGRSLASISAVVSSTAVATARAATHAGQGLSLAMPCHVVPAGPA
jgi:hypothetical protein